MESVSPTAARGGCSFQRVASRMWYQQAALRPSYIHDVLNELGFAQLSPTPVYIDNASLLALATKFSGSLKRVKHFLMRLNFLIEQVQKQAIHFVYEPTSTLCADALTKPLPDPSFSRHVTQLMGPQREHIIRQEGDKE